MKETKPNDARNVYALIINHPKPYSQTLCFAAAAKEIGKHEPVFEPKSGLHTVTYRDK